MEYGVYGGFFLCPLYPLLVASCSSNDGQHSAICTWKTIQRYLVAMDNDLFYRVDIQLLNKWGLETSLDSLPCTKRGSTIRFFNPVIPTQNVGQSRDPEGSFCIPPASRTVNPESSPDFALKFCFKILNLELQIREIPYPENPIEVPPKRDS